MKNYLDYLFEALGVLLIFSGLWLIYPPIALIALGACFFLISLVIPKFKKV